jgi:thymidylate synthase (FAD)
MRLFREPRVYLVAASALAEGMEEFLQAEGAGWWSDAPDEASFLVEAAGRVCYMSFAQPRPGGNKAYLHHLLEAGHGAVLEHATYSFVFSQVSRSLTHELVRHRAGWAYSMLSQRYVDEAVAEYIEPACIADDPDLHPLWLHAVEHAHEAYRKLATQLAARYQAEGLVGTELKKRARQAARSVLPNATETKIFVTANARALRHFLEMRCSRCADVEIRKLAYRVWQLLVEVSPHLFGDYTPVALPDGTQELATPYRKV